MDEILFSYLRLPLLNAGPVLDHIQSQPECRWFYDEYRRTWMLPLLTESGQVEKKGVVNRGGPLDWTSYAPDDLKAYFNEHIFNKLTPRGRIMVLRTQPAAENAEHIDCSPAVFATPQIKLRIVLQGNVDSLYFISDVGRRHVSGKDPDCIGRPFIIDGRWPHGMVNNFSRAKFTICLGSPWIGQGLEVSDLDKSRPQLRWGDLKMPTDHPKYFETSDARRRKLSSGS